jgi:hypothetical protein
MIEVEVKCDPSLPIGGARFDVNVTEFEVEVRGYAPVYVPLARRVLAGTCPIKRLRRTLSIVLGGLDIADGSVVFWLSKEG